MGAINSVVETRDREGMAPQSWEVRCVDECISESRSLKMVRSVYDCTVC